MPKIKPQVLLGLCSRNEGSRGVGCFPDSVIVQLRMEEPEPLL